MKFYFAGCKALLVGMLLLWLPLQGISQGTSGAGQAVGGGAITTAVPFLRIGPDSRSGALGDAGVAIHSDAYAMYWNPSALAFAPGRWGAGLSYTPWLRYVIPDINHSFLPVYYNLGEDKGTIGASLTYFSLGNIDFTNAGGLKTGSYNANEFALSGAYARKISGNFSLGVALRYIYSSLAGSYSQGGISLNPAQSVAGDLSLFYKSSVDEGIGGRPTTFTFGANISNLGAKMNYTKSSSNAKDFLPANLKVGAALKASLDETSTLTLTTDINKLLVPSNPPDSGQAPKPVLNGVVGSFGDTSFKNELRELTFSTGLEYWYNHLFAARTGWFHEDPTRGNRNYITMGVGIRFADKYQVDFAFLQTLTNNNPLQNTLRFSFTMDIGSSDNSTTPGSISR